MKSEWQVEERAVRYQDDNLCVVSESVRTPAMDHARNWTIVHRKQAVVIAAMTANDEIILVRQERIPIHMAIWEMPAGQIDEENPGREEIEATALRELEEETGYRLSGNGKLIGLGSFFASPGFTDEQEHLFLAAPVEPTGTKKEGEAITDCRRFTVSQIWGMIADHEIRDANTLACVARLAAKGLISLPPKDR